MYYFPQPPPGPPRVFDPKLGYVTEARLRQRDIRRDVNRLSFVAMALFAVSALGGFFLGMVLVFTGVLETGVMPEALFYSFASLMTVLGVGAPFFVYYLAKRGMSSHWLQFRKVGFGTGLLFVLAGSGICLAANFPVGWLVELMAAVGLSPAQSASPPATDALSAVFMFLAVAVLPAFFEEFAFRGVLLSVLRKYGDGFAIVVSSLIFAMAHMSLEGGVFALIAGLAMGFVYVKTGNLWLSIAIHFINNTVASISSLGAVPAADEITMGLVYGLSLLGLASILVLAFRKKLLLPRASVGSAPAMLSGGQKLLCVLSNPGFILFSLVFLTSAGIMLFGVVL